MQNIRYAAILFLAGFLPGCVVLPFPTPVEEVPFADEQTALIEPGKTTRQDIESAFGAPDIVRRNGSIALYGGARRLGGALVGVMSGGAVAQVESFHVLMLRFDSNHTVRNMELFRLGAVKPAREVCGSDGTCISPRFDSDSSSWFWQIGDSRLARAVVYDTPANDAWAKMLDVPPDLCAVYAYHNERLIGNRDMVIHRGELPESTLLIDESAYLHWYARPGKFSIVGTLIQHDAGGRPSGVPVTANGQPFEFDCVGGEPHFVNVSIREGWFKFLLEISLDDPRTGMASLQERRLMIE